MELAKEIDKIHTNIKAKNHQLAIEKLNKLIQKFPENSYLYNLCGLSLQQIQNIALSVKYFEKAIDLDPKNFSAKLNLANSLKVIGKLDLSEKLYLEILKVKPNYVKCLNNYANLKQQLYKFDDAINFYKIANKQEPNNIAILTALATAYNSIGETENSLKTIDSLLKINPNVMSAHKLKSSIIKYNNETNHLKEMLKLAENKELHFSQKIDLYFAIGKAFEDINNFDKAYYYVEKANKLKKSNTNFEINKEAEFFKNIKKVFSDIDLKASVKNRSKDRIIFICGMPRSGTTLLEQIIASHKDVSGAGELVYLQKTVKNNFYKDNFIDAGTLNEDINLERTKIFDDYMNLIKIHQFNKSIITDKAPQNFRFFGFIKIFFPNAKIIHCSRNAKDTCLSLYKNSFASTDMDWTYDQEDIAKYYNLYLDLIEFWKSKMAESIYDINYEKLISDKNNEIKRLLKFCDLDFDESCLSHHKSSKTPIRTVSVGQARKPIYKTSVNKYEKYKNNLNKMFSLLN